MIDVKRIYPECNSDTLLCELILQRGRLVHLHGITKVAHAIEHFPNNTLPVLGLVDSDRFKRIPQFLTILDIVEDRLSDAGLVLKQLNGTQKFVIFVHPEFEPWIFKQASACGINPADFGYHSINDLERESKPDDLRSNAKYKKFVNAVVMANPPGILTLRTWFEQIFHGNFS